MEPHLIRLFPFGLNSLGTYLYDCDMHFTIVFIGISLNDMFGEAGNGGNKGPVIDRKLTNSNDLQPVDFVPDLDRSLVPKVRIPL